MSIVAGIVGIVLCLLGRYCYEKACRDAGAPLLSSKQHRYIRRKANRTGTTLDTVDYKPRTRQQPLFFKDWLGPNSSIADTTAQPPSDHQPKKERGAYLVLAVITGAVILAYMASKSGVPTPPAPLEAQASVLQVAPSPTISPTSQIRIGRMKQTANVRIGPSNTATVLRTIPLSTAVQIVETNGAWAKISLNDEVAIGWVYRPVIQ